MCSNVVYGCVFFFQISLPICLLINTAPYAKLQSYLHFINGGVDYYCYVVIGENAETALTKKDVLLYLDSLNHYLNERDLRLVGLKENYNSTDPVLSQIVLELNWF